MSRLTALIAAFFVVLSLAFAAPVAAQDPQAPNYDSWTKLAQQAEQILQSNEANDARLQSIREQVVRWRDQFEEAEGTNSTRIATLKDQIAALPTALPDGQTESQDIADRRKALNEELSQVQAPGLQAVEAFGRADGIVQQIDLTLRQRQTYALIRKTPTPLNPANWASALGEAADVGVNVWHEVRDHWREYGTGPDAASRILVTLGIILAGMLLLSQGRRWVDGMPGRLSARASERSRAALVFGVSLGQIAIPFIGIMLGVAALVATDLFSSWGRPLLLSIPRAGLCFFGGLWLTRRVFPGTGPVSSPLPLTQVLADQAAFRAKMLALALALHQFFARSVLPLSGFHAQSSALTDPLPEPLSEASAGVWHFPIILLGAFFLFRLCSILRRLRPSDVSEAPDYRVRVVSFLGGVGRLIALAAPIAAAGGYVTLANAVLWAYVLTLALVGLLIVLQDFIGDFYAMAKGGDQSARDALMPVLIGFALVVMALPLFVLIWGARASDLVEAWSRAQQGFSLGGVTLSPMAALTFIIVFALGYFLTNFIQGALRSSILPKTRMDVGGQSAVASMIGYVGIALAAVFAITAAGINLTSLAFVAGALSVGIGFGMQQVVSNFVSGIILLVERPIAVGDWIEVGGQQGIVKKMAVRATQIQTFDRNDIIVPNSNLITQPVTNWTRGSLSGRIIVPLTVGVTADSREVTRILKEVAEDQPTVMISPAPVVFLRNITPTGLNFELRAVVSDINGSTGVVSEINHQILKRMAEAGIGLPGSARGASDVYLHRVDDAPAGPPAKPLAETAEQEEPASGTVTVGPDGPEGTPRA
ncbi:MAG: DUF3772 domain-containing protein [Paracoccus sp. (in: a-proteobacteria)]|uniref:DUF3772 domain-containing protein n=1 Tax=Paracoccus sp. TaxID=267 RepID=UPI0039E28550